MSQWGLLAVINVSSDRLLAVNVVSFFCKIICKAHAFGTAGFAPERSEPAPSRFNSLKIHWILLDPKRFITPFTGPEEGAPTLFRSKAKPLSFFMVRAAYHPLTPGGVLWQFVGMAPFPQYRNALRPTISTFKALKTLKGPTIVQTCWQVPLALVGRAHDSLSWDHFILH